MYAIAHVNAFHRYSRVCIAGLYGERNDRARVVIRGFERNWPRHRGRKLRELLETTRASLAGRARPEVYRRW